MRNGVCISLSIITAFCVSGCATYTIQPASSQDLDRKWSAGAAEKGYVFYQPELYFLVTPAGAAKSTAKAAPEKAGDVVTADGGAFTVTPIYLPNPKKPYRVTTFNLLAKSDFAFNFKDGWQLSSIADKADNSAIADTIAGELKDLKSGNSYAPLSLPRRTFLLHPTYSPETGFITGFSVINLPDVAE